MSLKFVCNTGTVSSIDERYEIESTMNRRDLLKTGFGLAAMAVTHRAFAEYDPIEYTPEAYQAALDSGEPLLVGFHADWCSTCRSQERAISALMDYNDAYSTVKVMSVDWDTHRRADFVKALRIPRRSTLVMFKDGKEVGRVVAQTAPGVIEELFKAVV